MLEAITWNTYFSTLAIGITAYYLYILFAYYPKELRGLVFGKAKQFGQTSQRGKGQHLGRTDEKPADHFEEMEATFGGIKCPQMEYSESFWRLSSFCSAACL